MLLISLHSLNLNGKTALIYASQSGHFNLVDLLLSSGADVTKRRLAEKAIKKIKLYKNNKLIIVILFLLSIFQINNFWTYI